MRAARGRDGTLVAGAVLVVLLVLHSLDHAYRHGDEQVPAAVSAAGAVGFLAALVALVLALAGHRLAARGLVFAGLGTAGGFFLVHVVPDWGSFSQPYSELDVDALSWAAMLATALLAAVIGFRAATTSQRA